MKPLRIAAFAALAVLYAAQLYAQTYDARIRTGGGGGSAAIYSAIFRLVSPSGNSPILPPADIPPNTPPNTFSDCLLLQPGKAPTSVPGCFFKNQIKLPNGTGITITRLIFVVDSSEYSGTPGPLVCGTETVLGGHGPFLTCNVQPVGDGSLSIVSFYNGSVPYGNEFSMGMQGFNSNAGFTGLALPNKDSNTAEMYELPDNVRPKSVLYRAVNDAPRFLGCDTRPLRPLSDLQRDQLGFDSSSIAGDTARTVQYSGWSFSIPPNSNNMPGLSPITFEALPTSGYMWRIT